MISLEDLILLIGVFICSIIVLRLIPYSRDKVIGIGMYIFAIFLFFASDPKTETLTTFSPLIEASLLGFSLDTLVRLMDFIPDDGMEENTKS